ncbi:MAG: monofunctional biosynthetic peptidoglycan transglycosylase [Gammaproteobacteria bacterium]|nr:monofunctional biosynthetic peptidoglycan transglycosylase [Gammaproteobacteria bacterium]
MTQPGKDDTGEPSPSRRSQAMRPNDGPLRDEDIPSIRLPDERSETSPQKAGVKTPKRKPGERASAAPTIGTEPRARAQHEDRSDKLSEPHAKPAAAERRGYPQEQGSKKKRRKWPRYLLAAVVALFLVTWLPVLIMRWVNPPTTAFMLETAAALESGDIRQTWVSYEQISKPMRLAVVASEDQTFPYNHGFDVDAIQEAIEHNQNSETTRGASTITQQTAKNLFLWPGGGYFRKAIEAWFTVLIDLDWPKRRVLEVYLNVAQFGPRIFGVEAAAQHYFGKPASQLTAPEAALLAATLPNPYAFDPAHPSPYLRQRQDWILEQMDHLGPHYLDSL